MVLRSAGPISGGTTSVHCPKRVPPAMTRFTDDSFRFLTDLAANNTRDWYMENKQRHRDHLQLPFASLLEALSNRLTDARRPVSGDKSTMFRLNRDVRFSENKAPYKTNVSGLLTPSGTKSQASGLVYIHLEPKASFVAAGFFKLSPKQLAPMRDAMIERADQFDTVLDALAASDRVLADMGGLSAMPRGYAQHAVHRHADHIKRTSLIVREDLPDALWLSGAVTDRIEQLARDAMPLLTFQDPAR